MKKLSVSKDRYRTRSIKSSLNKIYQKYFEQIKSMKEADEHNENWQENNLEYDLRTTDWILNKVRSSESYAQNLYAALCNNEFLKIDVVTILKNETWTCSWRYAGGIIADMREDGDYIDWYCTGIRDANPSEEKWNSWTSEQKRNWENIYSKYVEEGHVTDEIRADLQKLGWSVTDAEIGD